eukprot:TRINITY_DN533_c0_g1_i1.p2 TRINITY_DN533_c0_g1~~TRINITY_DN533_c0_g1_i1.p2  ORF type:complete len:166 (+),score=31.22 TRINITY_DN533_c0_g1_i1:957-1454(+)
MMTGHSFGGGTTVASIAQIPDIIGGVALDAWTYPLEVEKDLDSPNLQRSRLLFLNSELWQWRQNLDRMDRFCEKSGGTWKKLTLKGSHHHNFDESPLWFGPLLSKHILKLSGPNLDFEIGLRCIAQVCVRFGRNLLEASIESSTDYDVRKELDDPELIIGSDQER